MQVSIIAKHYAGKGYTCSRTYQVNEKTVVLTVRGVKLTGSTNS